MQYAQDDVKAYRGTSFADKTTSINMKRRLMADGAALPLAQDQRVSVT